MYEMRYTSNKLKYFLLGILTTYYTYYGRYFRCHHHVCHIDFFVKKTSRIANQ